MNDVSYDTEHALLEYGPNPTLQILIAKKRRQRAQKHLSLLRKKCAGGVWTLSMLSWSKVNIHAHRVHMASTHVLWLGHCQVEATSGRVSPCHLLQQYSKLNLRQEVYIHRLDAGRLLWGVGP